MIVEKNRTSIRYNDDIRNKALELISRYPDDYPSFSRIFRAGVIVLYNKRRGLKDELLHNEG